MKRKYAYVFTVGGNLFYSTETETTLRRRSTNGDDDVLIRWFIKANVIGSFIILSTGEMVFQTA